AVVLVQPALLAVDAALFLLGRGPDSVEEPEIAARIVPAAAVAGLEEAGRAGDPDVDQGPGGQRGDHLVDEAVERLDDVGLVLAHRSRVIDHEQYVDSARCVTF